jgi:subtilase family serine protease
MSVDPTDHCTFWYTQQYYSITSRSNWQTRIGSFSYPSCASGLPSVTVVASPALAAEDGSSMGVLTFSRTGSTSGSLPVNFAVTGTATPGVDYTALPSQITIPAGASTATLSVTALDDSLVEGNETLILTLAADPAYTTGTPSSAVVYVVSDDLPPDLVVSALSAPATAGAGQTIAVTDTTRNQGSGLASPSTTRFYLSTDTVQDAADLVLGARSVPTLAPGSNDYASTSVTIPAGTPGGAYYLLARADADDSNVETQESNNTNFFFVQIGPDLILTTLTAPSSTGAGSAITVNDTVKNQGSGTAGASTTRFFLSTNSVLDAADPVLGNRAVPALAPGATSSGSSTLTIPAATVAGTYYVLARADADNAVSETQEANNGNYVFIQIGPDLTITALTVPSTGGAGAAITISDTTRNQGGGAAGASTARFYLSTDSILDAGDVSLGARPVPALAAAASSSGSTTITIPATTAGGTYYILARADADNTVPETQEANNGNYAFIQIGPDLTISALSAPSTAGAGAAITLSDTTRNQGGGAAGASTTRFYLSTNTIFDAADVALGARSIPALNPSGTSSGSTTLIIPTGTAPGTYYLLARADADNVVSEAQESNNGNYAFFQVGPDLTISALTAPSTASAGSAITIADTTGNQGGGAAGASTTRFYLSTNTTFDAGDVSLGARAVPALSAGASSSGSTSVTILAGTAGGTYYLLARADADGAIAETQESNNTSYRSLQIGPDLVISALTAPATAAAGASITVSDTTRNQGGGAAGASTTRFYLSTNTLFDVGDVMLGGRSIPALAAGASSFGSSSATIPAGTPDGAYYLLARADGDEVVAEIQEFNNTYSVAIQIGPDLVVSAFTAPATAGAGAVLTLSDTTRNQGGGTAGASTTRFYLSVNTLADASDVVLGARSVPALGAGASHSASTSVTIPQSTATGAYYLLVVADADNVITETQEFNNGRYSFVLVGADLTLPSLTVPATTGAGSTITVSDTTRNQGGGAADPSSTAFYLSTNTVLDASDVLLGSRAIPALAPGVSSLASTSLTIPAGTAAGVHYVLVVADVAKVVVETQENNNYNFAYTQVGPDLVVWALTAPTSAVAGASITISDATRNQGGGSAGSSLTRFYLSTDAVVDAGDVPLGSRAIAALAPGATDSGSIVAVIPAGTLAGSYYILAIADADNTVAETQEFNNRRHAFISVTAN